MKASIGLTRSAVGAVATAMALALAGPAAADEPTTPTVVGSWRFIEAMGTAIPDTLEATLNLSADGNARGKDGCNDFSGRYVLDGLNLTFSDMMSTKMWCSDPLTNTVEWVVGQALDRTTRVATPPGELDLLDRDAQKVARLAAVPPPDGN